MTAAPNTTHERISAVDVLWRAMTGAYGTGWTQRFGDYDETGVWAKGLAKYHPQQVTQAIADAIRHHQTYPPTLGQFMALCRDAMASDAYLQLEHQKPKITREEQRQWLADLKEMQVEAKKRGPMTPEQRERNLKILGLDDASQAKKQDRHVTPGSTAACAYSGCSAPGSMSSTLSGTKSWYCADHFIGVSRQ